MQQSVAFSAKKNSFCFEEYPPLDAFGVFDVLA